MSQVTQLRRATGFAAGLYRERYDRWYAGRFRGDALARLRLREGRRDPYAIYEEMRARGPMLPTRLGNWATTSHPLASQVLRSRRFGVRELEGAVDGGVVHGGVHEEVDLSFLGLNPPDHTRLRRLASPAFSPRMMGVYSEKVERTVAALLDAAERRGDFDLVADFAAPLPIAVITGMMGVPAGDIDAFQRYGTALGSALDGLRSLRHAREVLRANAELEAIFESLFVLREREPGDDLISALVAERGDRIQPHELVPLCSLLLVAGFETTVNLIGNAVLALLGHPEQWQALRDDPGLASSAVEEVLRWDPPVRETGRVAFEEIEIGGVPVRANQWVVLLLAATGRDPEVFPDPSRFDITRTPGVEHLAFSSGIHYCIGAPLARLEATAALTAIAQRLPRLRQRGPMVMRSSTTIRGPLHLPVTVG